MLRNDFVFKVLSKSPEIVHAKRFEYQAIKEGLYYKLYRIPFMEKPQLYATIPIKTKDVPATWEYHIRHANQYYNEDGSAKIGGSNGRYPGCGLGASPHNNFYKIGKARKNILFLC